MDTHFHCSSIIAGSSQHVHPNTRVKHTAHAIYAPPVALVTCITCPRYPWCIFSTAFPTEINLYCRETNKEANTSKLNSVKKMMRESRHGTPAMWLTLWIDVYVTIHDRQYQNNAVFSFTSRSGKKPLCCTAVHVERGWSGFKLVLTQSRWVLLAVHRTAETRRSKVQHEPEAENTQVKKWVISKEEAEKINLF